MGKLFQPDIPQTTHKVCLNSHFFGHFVENFSLNQRSQFASLLNGCTARGSTMFICLERGMGWGNGGARGFEPPTSRSQIDPLLYHKAHWPMYGSSSMIKIGLAISPLFVC